MLLSARICNIILHVSKTSQPQQKLLLNWILLKNCFKSANLLIWFDSNISQYTTTKTTTTTTTIKLDKNGPLGSNLQEKFVCYQKANILCSPSTKEELLAAQSMLSQKRVWLWHNWTVFSKKGAFCQVALSSTVHFLFRSLPQLCFCLALTQSNMWCNIPAADELWMRLRFW